MYDKVKTYEVYGFITIYTQWAYAVQCINNKRDSYSIKIELVKIDGYRKLGECL